MTDLVRVHVDTTEAYIKAVKDRNDADEELLRKAMYALEGVAEYTALLDDYTINAAVDSVRQIRVRLGVTE
jgi:hypothetical protein